jgi:hypothetical protein
MVLVISYYLDIWPFMQVTQMVYSMILKIVRYFYCINVYKHNSESSIWVNQNSHSPRGQILW